MAYRTRLDDDGCVDLLRILQVVKQIDQEQAWAICYEVCTLMKGLASRHQEQQDSQTTTTTAPRCAPIESLSQVHIHKDGHVHEKTCLLATTTTATTTTTTTTTTRASTTNGSWLQKRKSSRKYANDTSNSSGSSTSNNHNHLSNSQDEAERTQVEDFGRELDEEDEDSREINTESGDPSPTRTPTSPSPSPSPSSSPSLSFSGESRSQSRTGSPTNSSCSSSSSSPELEEILKRRPALDEYELVASLGIALFWALDYGIPNDEERKLSIAMEYLIFQSQSKLTFDEVLELCLKRLATTTRSKADAHYKGVCKSLVQDTIQLSIFLEKIYTASMVLGDISEQELSELGEPLASLRALKIDDWARLWMHVIKELKQALAIT